MATINPQISELCRRSKVSDYLTNKGVDLIRAGSRVKCKCPLPDHPNDNTPSFYISTQPDGTELFKCFGCGRGGNIITLIRSMEGGKNGKIINRLAKAIGITLSPFAPGTEVHIDPTNDDIMRSFCDEDAMYQEIASYALEIMTLHKGSSDIVNKVSKAYKKMDEMIEKGDKAEALLRVRKLLKDIAMEEWG